MGNRKLAKEVTGWREQCTFFWEKDPKSLFVAGKKDTREDRVEFRGKLEKMLRELKIEDDKHETMLSDVNKSSSSDNSSLVDSGIRDNFSTTGALGDSEGMDTTMETTMETSLDEAIESPREQRKNNKR